MPEPSTFLVFALASLALLVVPGPTMLYIVSRSLAHGRSAGLVSVLGVQAGELVHVALAALGVSALLASSPVAFAAVKYLGAGYLVWLAVQRLRARGEAAHAPAPPPSRGALLRQGALVSALNPKTALFFLAFLPQFVDPARGDVALQAALLGLCFTLIATVNDGLCALLAGAVGDRVRGRGRLQARLDRAGGVVLLGLAGVAVGA